MSSGVISGRRRPWMADAAHWWPPPMRPHGIAATREISAEHAIAETHRIAATCGIAGVATCHRTGTTHRFGAARCIPLGSYFRAPRGRPNPRRRSPMGLPQHMQSAQLTKLPQISDVVQRTFLRRTRSAPRRFAWWKRKRATCLCTQLTLSRTRLSFPLSLLLRTRRRPEGRRNTAGFWGRHRVVSPFAASPESPTRGQGLDKPEKKLEATFKMAFDPRWLQVATCSKRPTPMLIA